MSLDHVLLLVENTGKVFGTNAEGATWSHGGVGFLDLYLEVVTPRLVSSPLTALCPFGCWCWIACSRGQQQGYRPCWSAAITHHCSA